MSWGGWQTGRLAARRQLRPGALLAATLALSVGAAMTGLTAYSVLNREARDSFTSSKPPHAVLNIAAADASTLSRAIEWLGQQPGVEASERREVLIAEVQGDDRGWRPVFISRLQDLEDMRVGRVHAPTVDPSEAGPWLWLERSAVPLLGPAAAQGIRIRSGGGPEVLVPVSDLVWDAGTAPGWMDGLAHAYTDPPGYAAIFGALGATTTTGTAARVLLRFAPTPPTVAAVRNRVDELQPLLGTLGATQVRAEVPPVEEHPHEGQYKALVFTLAALTGAGALVGFALSLFVFRIWFEKHRPSVGVMRALGSGGRQAALFAFRLMAPSALVGVLVGIGVGWVLGRGFVGVAAPILNLEVVNGSPTAGAWMLALVGVVTLCGLLMWSVSARTLSIPVSDTLRASTHAAPSTGWAARTGGFLPFAALWPLRATLRAPTSLLMAVGFLGAAGAAFLASGHVSSAWDRTLAASAAAQRSDGFVSIESTPAAELELALSAVEPINAHEIRRTTFALVGPPGAEPIERASVIGVGVGALDPLEVQDGVRGSPHAVVVNHRLARLTNVEVGGSIRAVVGGEALDWPVGGIVTEYTPALRLYAPQEWIGLETAGTESYGHNAFGSDMVADEGTVSGFLFRFAPAAEGQPADDPSQWEALRAALETEGVRVRRTSSTRAASQSIVDHVKILWAALLFSSAMLGGLGVIGLGVALALSVSERRTEFGVLRAIGIQPRTLAIGVVGQSLAICMVGAVMGLLISGPVGSWVGNQSGQLFVQADLLAATDRGSVWLWFALVLASAVAAALPSALKATRISVREAFDR